MSTQEVPSTKEDHNPAQPQLTPSPLTWLMFFVGGTISVVLDQWSKAWAAKTLLQPGVAVEVGGMPLNPHDIRTRVDEVFSWFNYRLAGNKGAAWGIFNDFSDAVRVPFFVILSAAALTFLLIVFYNSAGQRLMLSLIHI